MSEFPFNEKVIAAIGKAEALILFELLADFHSQPVLKFHDNADRLALVRLHGALESTLATFRRKMQRSEALFSDFQL